MSAFVWLNDELVDAQQASVSVFDHGLTVADGIFETLKVVDGHIFALDRHLDRLQNSANILGLGRLDRASIQKGCNEVLAANSQIPNGRMRITVTSGSGPLGSDRFDSPVTLVIAMSSTTPWPQQTSIVVVPWTRNERSSIAGAKSTSYAENVVALTAAHDAGFSEAVFTDSRGHISEGTGTNIFLVSGGELVTPSIDTGLLQGVTRNLVIQWAQEAGYVVHERTFSTAYLLESDEVFLTSTTRDVHPVTSIGVMSPDRVIASRVNKPLGPVTIRMQEIFTANSKNDWNP